MSGDLRLRRHLSIWLPRLPSDRIRLRRLSAGAAPAEAAAPLVTVARVGNATRLIAVDQAAAALGLAPGLALADAEAMYPGLDAVPADPGADRALLEDLADAMELWTPLVAPDPPDGLLLDITGCAHLFGGEAAMAGAIRRRLMERGFAVRLASAATVGCAAALARHGAEIVAAAGREAALLAPLPVAALRIGAEIVAGLRDAGLETVGDLMTRPRAPLAARFGAGLMRRLDQALGTVDEPISPRRPVPDHMVERRLMEPIQREDHVLDALTLLGDGLGARLTLEGLGATRLEAVLFRVDGAVRRLAIGAGRPLRRGDEMRRLFADRLAGLAEPVEAGFGFEAIRLSAPETRRVEPRQPGFDGGTAIEAETALAALTDHLAARLGPGRLRRLAPRDSHVPERAMQLAEAAAAPPPFAPPDQDSLGPARPLRLLERAVPVEALAEVPDGPPRRLRWQGEWHDVRRAEGPERIAPEWWRADTEEAATRDYFRIETAAGLRLWLYRDGLYGRETDRPRWYLHGFLP
ncbi:DNA polymerase Y family protein [Zavarzinia compransoris]|uniref:Y-family DNA polymerase n=1 Tax=Zavarzinia marina TaxID=2911065 RepID=UPI001F338444|nr:DNA polymerase Y family protein [Zavarzinia marina]MCF4164672.1 DNA polymerase Y family protein [Zavarzinia marina]